MKIKLLMNDPSPFGDYQKGDTVEVLHVETQSGSGLKHYYFQDTVGDYRQLNETRVEVLND